LKDSALRLAASVLEAQPDPPRQVSFIDVLKTRTNLLLVVPLMGAVLVLAGVLRTGSPSRGGPTNYVALGILLSLSSPRSAFGSSAIRSRSSSRCEVDFA
jgi:hypothetical protein